MDADRRPRRPAPCPLCSGIAFATTVAKGVVTFWTCDRCGAGIKGDPDLDGLGPMGTLVGGESGG